jgi:integrase
MLGAIFANAVRHQLIEANPAKGARKIAGKRRSDRLTLDELRRLGEVIRVGNENPTAVAAIRLIALTGLRRNEALGLRPSSIIAAGGLDLPATKTGPARRPIGRAALESIAAQIQKSGSRDWIFPADRGDGHFIGLPKSLARLCKAAKLRSVTAHTLRHTFASIAAEIGFSELTIAGLLGHAAGSVTAGYVHLDSALVSAADRVSATIADALDGKEGAKVIPLRAETGSRSDG